MATPKKKGGPRKKRTATNKNGVKNSLVNNINARKKKGTTRKKKNTTVSKKAYEGMKENWGK